MKKLVPLIAVVAALFLGGLAATRPAWAQQLVWLQIEARPSLRQAQERARAYSGAFANVEGFALSSGWYAIVLGPYAPDAARVRLESLRSERLIPNDAFVADGSNYRRQFWPIGANVEPTTPEAQSSVPDATTPPDATTGTTPDTAATGSDVIGSSVPGTDSINGVNGAADSTVAATPVSPAPVQETPAEARQSEALLDRDQREALQEALKWQGFYDGAIDGAIGPGTRGAMSAWQSARGFDATGILTTSQRATLMDAVSKEKAALGLKAITDRNAGIEITLPAALIADAPRYDPPFAHYEAKDGSGVQVLLISEPGDTAALAGLYDVLQTLRIVPMSGNRSLERDSFTIEGKNDEITSYAHAELKDGLIKGYILAWKAGTDETRMARVLAAMKASFRPIGAAALDATMVATPADQRRDLLAGLELRKPVAARTGFFVDKSGTVLTTDAVMKGCGKITVGAGHDATALHEDKTLGIVLLKPQDPLAPRAVAQFETAAPGLGDPAAVAGFSYGGVLTAPVMTYGTLEGLTGLQGEDGVRRVALNALPGDAGGPVFDRSGAVLGMLLPRPGEEDGKVLPDNVRFVADAGKLVSALSAAGVTPTTSAQAGMMAPEDLSTLGSNMAVLVQCWK